MTAGGPVTIRTFCTADVDAYRATRLQALATDPDAFGTTYALEAARPLAEHADRLATSHVLGAYHADRTLGLVGFRQQQGPKESHKGFVWGFWVDPAWRGRGAGAALLSGLLDHARTQVDQVTLTVVAGNTPAIERYRRAGFTVYGTEPRSLKTAAGTADELLMVLLF